MFEFCSKHRTESKDISVAMASWCVTRSLRRLYWNAVKPVKTPSCTFVAMKSSTNKISSMSRISRRKINWNISPIRERLLYPQQTFVSDSDNRCEDELIAQILNSPSIDEIFDLIDPKRAMSPPQVHAAFAALDSLLTKHIHSFSWALTQHPILGILQSFINNESKGIYQVIQSCPEFDRLCSEAVRHRFDFTNDELLFTTLSLFKLTKIDLDNRYFVSLLIECQNREESLNLGQLAIYCDIANLMKRNGFFISSQIIRVLAKQMSLYQTEIPSEEEFKSLIKIFNTIGYFCTTDHAFDLQNQFHGWLNRYKDDVDQLAIVTLTETISRFASSSHPQILDLLNNGYFLTKCKQMTSWELFRLVMLLNASAQNPKLLSDGIAARADELIRVERLKTTDIVFLAIVYEFLNFPDDSRKVIEDLLTLHFDEVDIILLRYLALSTVIFTSKNSNFISEFYRLVWNRKNELFESVSCLLGVVKCLAKISINQRSRNLDSVLSRELLNVVLNGQHPSQIATFSVYLIKCLDLLPRKTVPLFYNKLLTVIPNCSIVSLLDMGLGIPNHSYRRGGDEYPLMFCRLLAKETVRRKDELKNMRHVNLFAKNILQKLDRNAKMAILPQIVQIYNQTIDSIDEKSISFIVRHIGVLRLNLPLVFDRISQKILENSESFTLTDISRVLNTLATFDHRSESSELLGKLVTEKVDALGSRWSSHIKSIIIALNSLATMQIFPKELINRVFTLDFLSVFDEITQHHEVDEEISYPERHSSNIESQKYLLTKTFMQLNQTLLLQCPHIPVPWVCDRIYKRQNDTLHELTSAGWKTSIYEGLVSALGDEDFVKVGPLSTQLGHTYDFEILLDVNRNPVLLNSDNWHFRVAVLLMKPSNYSLNDNRLLGPTNALLTQLEILEYIVLQVPYYKLDEMKLISPQKRTKYFKDLIFKNEPIEFLD
ncbi:hypothetical protein CHUAL_002589 [Chamberlinius hualienensis]